MLLCNYFKFCLIFIMLEINCAEKKRFLIYGGKTGWIGQKIMRCIELQGHTALAAQARLENRQDIEREVMLTKPDFIINAAGVIGRPNVDWCETNKQETIRANIIGALNVVDVGYVHNIHTTIIGTGCIYDYDKGHPMYSGIGFSEDDEPNFDKAWYCKTKIMLEKMLMAYPNMLYLRMRLPVSSDINPRNLITKLTRYEKVVNIPNCLTILDDLVPLISHMAISGLSGIYNFVNPGVISHNEMLDMYKAYVDPTFSYQNFSIEEQRKILKVARCYNELDVTKLLKLFPGIPHVKDSMARICKEMGLQSGREKKC